MAAETKEKERPYVVLEQIDDPQLKTPVYAERLTVSARNTEHALRLARVEIEPDSNEELMLCAIAASMWNPVPVGFNLKRTVNIGG